MTQPMRAGTAAEWQAENPVLKKSAIALDLDTGLMRLGDGMTPYSQLTGYPSGSLSYDPVTRLLQVPGMRQHVMTRNGVAAASDTAIHAAVTLGTGVSVTKTDCNAVDPASGLRVITAKGNAAGITGKVVLSGIGRNGVVVYDSITLSGTSSVAGVIPMSSVTSAVFPPRNAGGDTVSLGIGMTFGLDLPIAAATDVFMVERVATGAWGVLTVTTDYTASATYGTVTMVAISASDIIRVTYQSTFL